MKVGDKMVYNSKKSTKQVEVNNTLFKGVVSMLKKHSTWVGTMTELNSTLVETMGRRVPAVWPGSPSALRVSFNQVVNRLRNAGISIRFARSKSRLVKLIMQ